MPKFCANLSMMFTEVPFLDRFDAAARAEFETLHDRPYEDKKKIRVAGPFTVESLSPHRAPAVDEHGELIAEVDAAFYARGFLHLRAVFYVHVEEVEFLVAVFDLAFCGDPD